MTDCTFASLFTLWNARVAVTVWQSSDVEQRTLADNAVFRRGFSRWLGIGVVFLILLNLIGFGTGKNRFVGMPATVASTFGHDGYALLALALDLGFALGHAYLLGLGMAYRATEAHVA